MKKWRLFIGSVIWVVIMTSLMIYQYDLPWLVLFTYLVGIAVGLFEAARHKKLEKKMMLKYADLIRRVHHHFDEDLTAKCGYDLMNGLHQGDAHLRAEAWEERFYDVAHDRGYVDEERDGIWVPAISENIKERFK